ncbi:hypothetical protein EG68_12034 [Paragonimus skrjabini miyazakii]|uniref:Uncharacterized protein n=1 Tax=Paragonimus skrjabini miyazakii TaxID=59628 RepID=A0A8S9YIS2_9TREM|nr:hypothetical protein EG68_12034 [Paragonimus skrjabini miyazakii]
MLLSVYFSSPVSLFLVSTMSDIKGQALASKSPFIWHNIFHDFPNFKTGLCFYILKLNGALFLWIGTEEGTFSGLSLCVPSHLVNDSLHSCQLYKAKPTSVSSNSLGLHEENLSRRIAKRFQCSIYVSLSLPAHLESAWDCVNPSSQDTLSKEVESFLVDQLVEYTNALRIEESC